MKCGPSRNIKTKVIRKRTINENGEDKEVEEEVPGDELIVKKIKYGKEPKSKILRKIIILKDGKEQEIEEEIPLEEFVEPEKVTKKTVIEIAEKSPNKELPKQKKPKESAYKKIVKTIASGLKEDNEPEE